MIVEDENCHNLLSTSWRTRKASGIIQSKFEGLRNKSQWSMSCGPKAQEPRASVSEGRRRWPVQLKKRKREFTLPPPFCSIQALCGLDDAHLHWWKRSFLSLPVQRLISSRETFADTPTNNILSAIIWASLSLVKLTYNIKHHSLVLPLFDFFKWTTICLCFGWENFSSGLGMDFPFVFLLI